MDRAEHLILQIAVAGLAACLIRALILWVRDARPRPDPWGPELDQLLEGDLLPRSCLRCSAPHGDAAWFCPECGAATGDYNNCNPYLGAFSLGEVLRTGTFGLFKVTPLTVLGYLILPVSTPNPGCIFAPVYWVLLVMNLAGSPVQSPFPSKAPPPLPPPTGPGNDGAQGSSP